MTFIESLLGLSPDNGSGATETSVLLAVLALVCMCLVPYLVRQVRQ
jgi:hypothetical protein